MIKPWKVLERSEVYRADPWFVVERQRIQLPDGRVIGDYHRIAFPDCAGTVVQLEDGRYLAARQYRHGPGRVSLTLPGGALNPGEEPLQILRAFLPDVLPNDLAPCVPQRCVHGTHEAGLPIHLQ
jgi:ADP-ribose pyrophosphatase